MKPVTKFQIGCEGGEYCFQIVHDQSSDRYGIAYLEWRKDHWKPIDSIKFTKNEAECLVKFLELTFQFSKS
jgi:hypothetical protein